MRKIIILLLLASQSVLAQENQQMAFLQLEADGMSKEIRQRGPFHAITRDKKGKVIAALDRPYIVGDQVFLRIRVSNHSAISYDVDLIKFFIRDRKTARRTITQELEVHPVERLFVSRVPGRQKRTFVFTLDKFTLADNKVFCSELFEKGGGRHLQLRLKGNHLNRALPLPSSE
ncbi:MAG TPA: DUF4138 domain-containing protein [Sphingobacteriaceae bacterium]